MNMFSRTTIRATGTTLAIPWIAELIAGQLGYPVAPFASNTHPSIDGCRAVLKELKFLKFIKKAGK